MTTVLPPEAGELLQGFSLYLQEGGLSKIQAATALKMGVGSCFEIYVYAGVVQITPNEDIQSIIQGAMTDRKIVARHICV